MGKMQRRKGAAYEREVAAHITRALGPTKRVLGQARDGGFDLEAVSGLAFECKRRASIAMLRWMEQAQRAVEGTTLTPVVVMREDNAKQSFVLLPFSDFLDLVAERNANKDA